jgi:CRP-like cAMP-binding protein
VRLDELRTQALRYLALGDFAHALQVYGQILTQQPTDLDSRTRVADVLVQLGQRDLAKRVYAAVAYYDLQGGRPLHAVVAIQALSDLGENVSQLRLALAQLYGAGSPKIAKFGARLAPPLPDTQVAPPDLSRPVGLEEMALAAAGVAANTQAVSEFPSQFPPVPLLSDLTDRAFAHVLDVAVVQRLAHGTLLIKAGDPGDAFFLLAAGDVRVFTLDEQGQQQELARLHEGAIFGEMALINAQPRSASVEVVGSADVISLGRKALQAAAGELEAIASALDKFTRDRLLKNLLSTSALFKPFTPQQRIDLVRRFTGHEVDEGADIIREGDPGQGLYLLLSGGVEVLKGGDPFPTQIAELGPGECFGEISLVLEQPAMATVRATRRSTVLFLAREYFTRLTEALPEIRAYFEALSEERLRSNSLRLEPADLLEEVGEDHDSRVLF